MRDYGKVHSSFWSSSDMRALSEDARALAMYLLTCPHGTIAGVFRLPDGYVCDDMQWTAQRVGKGFMELLAKGFANRCETTKWVWICKHLAWNPPENPNQRKAALKIANQIPSECAWIACYIKDCAHLIGWDSPPVIEPLPNGYGTVAEPVAVTVAVAVAGTVAVTGKGTSLSQANEPDKKPKARTLPNDFAISDAVKTWATASGFSMLNERFEHFIGYAKANGKTYTDWDQAFINSIRGDWAKLNGRGYQRSAVTNNDNWVPPEMRAPSEKLIEAERV